MGKDLINKPLPLENVLQIIGQGEIQVDVWGNKEFNHSKNTSKS